jgi:hypothetical protein
MSFATSRLFHVAWMSNKFYLFFSLPRRRRKHSESGALRTRMPVEGDFVTRAWSALIRSSGLSPMLRLVVGEDAAACLDFRGA